MLIAITIDKVKLIETSYSVVSMWENKSFFFAKEIMHLHIFDGEEKINELMIL
jgi:hypothetical protein